MLTYLRRHASLSSVVAVLALVFAMTGGAYAAKKYLITSTSQIKPSVLKSLQGKAGLAGAPGPQGAQGLPGPAGTNGTNGKDGKDGSNGGAGPVGPAGATGKKGDQGEPGSKGATGSAGASGPAGTTGPAGVTGPEGVCATASCHLPSGATETGTWIAAVANFPEGSFPAAIAISFPIPLKEASTGESHAFYFSSHETEEIEKGEKNTGASECKGTVVSPTAPAGKLCVYTELQENKSATPFFVLAPGGTPEQYGKTGATVIFGIEAPPSRIEARGTWAVTAP